MYYSSGLVKNHVLCKKGDTAVQEYELNWTPVKVGTFGVYVVDENGAVIDTAVSDAFGNFKGANMEGVVTPAGTITFKDVPDASKGDIVVTYKFDNNSVKQDGYTQAGFTNAPAIELEIKSVPVNAETRTLRAYWALTKRQAPRYSNVA